MAVNRLPSWLAVTMRRPVHFVPEPLTSLKAAESAEFHLSVFSAPQRFSDSPSNRPNASLATWRTLYGAPGSSASNCLAFSGVVGDTSRPSASKTTTDAAFI